jgi:hypothetical protein
MADEELTTEQVDDTVSPEAGADSETQETEQETQPEITEEKTEEKTFTQSEVEAMFDKKSARLKRQLQREFEESKKEKAPEAKQPLSNDKPPNVDDYESTEEWVRATVKYERDLEKAEEAAARQAEEDAKIRKSFERKADKFEQTHPDYMDVMDDLKTYNIPGYIMHSVMTADLAPDIAYFLGQNQEELENILDMNPADAIRRIGKIEAKLETTDPIEKTKAPAPLKTLKGTGTVEETTYNKGDDFDKFLDTRYQELGRGRRQR